MDAVVDLAKYRSIRDYIPHIGDMVIRHGVFSRTKWFGIVNGVTDDGTMSIVTEGLPYLLFTMPPTLFPKKSIQLHVSQMMTRGAYSVSQHDKNNNAVVWYI